MERGETRSAFGEFLDVLADAPWWVSAVFGLIANLMTRYVFPDLWPDPNTLAGMLAGLAAQYSWLAGVFIVPALISVFGAPAKLRVIERQEKQLYRHTGQDLTPYMTLAAQMAAAALFELKGNLRRVSERDEELRDMLQADPLINHRQRSVLGRALRNADAEFRIAYHKTTHNVVYATARADLLGLVDKGYLKVEKRNRAMVFMPAHDLKARLERDHPPVARG